MRITALLAPIALLSGASACARRPAAAPGAATASVERSERIVAGRARGDGSGFAGFVPAVAAVTEGGECARLASRPGQTLFLLSFPSRTASQRNVSVVVDTAGTLLTYSDLRGDLRRPELRTGPVTAITINFERSLASATNEPPGQIARMVQGTPAQLLAAEHLGPPGALIAQLRDRCGAPIRQG